MIRDPRDPAILDLCRIWGPLLNLKDDEPNGAACLYTLFLKERYNQHNPGPRREPAYATGGRYANQELLARYGDAAACSYSNWQIMFPVARELGYLGRPADLDDDATAIQWVVKLIQKRIEPQARRNDGRLTLAELADAYNSGNCRDANVPHEYIAQAERYYVEALSVLT